MLDARRHVLSFGDVCSGRHQRLKEEDESAQSERQDPPGGAGKCRLLSLPPNKWLITLRCRHVREDEEWSAR